jgi:hypothetical protein
VELLSRGSADYEAARRASVWSQRVPDRFPDAIAAARSVDDVVEIVRRGQPVTVRGSGHSHAATHLRDGGVLLDLSGLDDARLDGTRVSVGPGIRSAALAAFLGERGRALPTGHNATVAIGGFLLGGGMGWNGESWGQFSCFAIRALEVVTAAGDVVTATEDDHPELLWAARGCGPGFPGIVTRFELDTYPLPTAIHASAHAYPLESAAEVADWLHGVAQRGLDDVECFMAFRDRGDGTMGCFARLIAFRSDAAEAIALLDELDAAAPSGPLRHESAGPGGAERGSSAGAVRHSAPTPVTFESLYAMSVTGAGLRVLNDTLWTPDPVAVAARFAERIAAAPSPDTTGVLGFRAAGRPLPDAALSVVAPGFLNWGPQWRDPADDDANERWVDETIDALAEFETGCFVNETDIVRHPERAALCWSAEAAARLAEIRAAWDPEGRFPPAY